MATRQIVLDTETTGLEPKEGHRLIEIGCVELINRRLTGKHFHYYINPERDIDKGAQNVHGLTKKFLADKPLFRDVALKMLDFIRGAELIIHNAPFDVGFLNHELNMLDPKLGQITDHATVFDTLLLARQMHPGQRNSLDALCKRYQIDNSHREMHGALLDAEILARVYLAMTGGQANLFKEEVSAEVIEEKETRVTINKLKYKETPIILVSDEELIAHQERLAAIEKAAGQCLWSIND